MINIDKVKKELKIKIRSYQWKIFSKYL